MFTKSNPIKPNQASVLVYTTVYSLKMQLTEFHGKVSVFLNSPSVKSTPS